MDLMSEALYTDQLKGGKYSTLLSKSTKAQKSTYLNTFVELEDKAKTFYKACLKRANNKDWVFERFKVVEEQAES